MSLFKLRDWWSVECGDQEEFDQNSLCVANIDNNPSGSDKIIIASHSGILRIYSINTNVNEDGNLMGFQPSDLLLEIDLKDPILQIVTGLFLSASDKIHLAVLQQRKLSVFSISSTAGVTEHGSSYNMLLIYEHVLQRNAYNLIHGPFGQVKDRDFVCVQSLDGNLTFYEQESLAFSRSLPNCLLPGPLAYVPHSDSFVVATSAWCLESYRYQVLAISKGASESENDKHSKGRKVLSDWNVVLGEPIIDIKVVSVEKIISYIFVLSERNYYALKENGTIWFMKRFDFSPSCVCVFPNETADSIMTLVATHIFTLLIYSNDILKWAAQLPFTPVKVVRANLKTLQGLIVCLSSGGFLCCGYLGTSPSLKIVPTSTAEKKLTDFSTIENELQELRKIINVKNGHELDLRKDNIEHDRDLTITAFDIQTLTNLVGTDSKTSATPSVQLTLRLESTNNLNNLKVTVDLPKSLVAEPNVVTFPLLKSSDSPVFNLIIWRENFSLPSSARINLIATYNKDNGAPRLISKIIHLPLTIFAKLVLPVKEGEHVLDLEIYNDQQSSNINLFELFSDLFDSNRGTEQIASNNGLTIGLEIYGDHNVISINTSLSSTKQKFRVQCDSFGALSFVTNELIRRLKRNEVKFNISKLNKNFIPTATVFSLIDQHLSLRIQIKNILERISNSSIQLRAIQKRLLVKLKERHPMPLNNLDTLMKALHNQLMNLSDQFMKTQQELEKVSCNLNSSIKLTCSLLLIATQTKPAFEQIIKSVFTYNNLSNVDEGWEERTEAAIITLLSKQTSQLTNVTKFANNQFTSVENTEHLKNCIKMLIKKLLEEETLDRRGATHHKNSIHTNKAIEEENE